MTHAARILDSLRAWLGAGPLGDKLRPSEYRLLISCGFVPPLTHAGDIGTIHTSCGIFMRGILHDSGVLLASHRGTAGQALLSGWVELTPGHPSAVKWKPGTKVGPGWPCFIQSATDPNNCHVFFLVELMPVGMKLPNGKTAVADTWKIAQGGGGDGTRCDYGYRILGDPNGRPLRYVFDPELIGVSTTADTEPPPRDSLPTTPDPFRPPRVLKLSATRMTGYDVELLQRKLGITADGIFGPLTHAAVQRYQETHGLRTDGIVGNYTRRSLGL